MKRPHLNITQKFVIYMIVISVIPLLVVGMSSYAVSETILQEEAARYSSTVVAHQRDYLELQLEQIESLIANITGVEEIINVLGNEGVEDDSFTNLATKARIGYILNGYSNLRGLVSIDIFSMGGTHFHVGDTLDVSNIRMDVREDILDKTIASEQIVFWSGIEDNVNANSAYEKVLTAAKVITKVDPDTLKSEPVALFLVNISLDDMYMHLSQLDLGEGAHIMVIDTKDRIIYHPDRDYIGAPLASLDKNIHSLLTDDTGEFVTTFNEHKVFVSYARLSVSDWVVLSLIPIDTLTAKTAVIRNNTLMILFISFLFVGAFAWLYNRDVVLPIRQITYRFQQLQSGSPEGDMRMKPRGNDEIGELVQWFNAFIDTLSARREAELQIEASLREKEALLQEIHHRVKNNLQVISSLLNLQASRTQDPQITAVFKNSQNRIQSMSLIHEKLYRSKDFSRVNLGEYVRNLTTYLVRSYRTDTGVVNVEIETDEVYIGIETAVPCGLLLNELISNALKHAFPDGRTGKITILLQTKDRQVTLVVGDDGVGLSDDEVSNEETLGFQLIKTLVNQIGAVLKIETDQGSRFTITFDLPPEVTV